MRPGASSAGPAVDSRGRGLTLSPVSLLLAIDVTTRRGKSRIVLYQLARIFGKFLANGFWSEGTASGKSENDRINTGDLWWAWVDLNHRPRPYQGRGQRVNLLWPVAVPLYNFTSLCI